jgi:ribonuclease P protein component
MTEISTAKNTFKKTERLHSKKRIDVLFAGGKHIQAAPLKLIYLLTETELNSPAQAMFVVPKRLFKKAHDRNKLKRRMKEAYRLTKNNFYSSLNQKNKKVILAFLYTSKKSEDFEVINASLLKLLTNLIHK